MAAPRSRGALPRAAPRSPCRPRPAARRTPVENLADWSWSGRHQIYPTRAFLTLPRSYSQSGHRGRLADAGPQRAAFPCKALPTRAGQVDPRSTRPGLSSRSRGAVPRADTRSPRRRRPTVRHMPTESLADWSWSCKQEIYPTRGWRACPAQPCASTHMWRRIAALRARHRHLQITIAAGGANRDPCQLQLLHSRTATAQP